MKLAYTALALSAPSVFGYGPCDTESPNATRLHGDLTEDLPIIIDNPGTFYYFMDYEYSEPGFRVCPLNDTSGSFTITAGNCVLTDEGCVTSPLINGSWPGPSVNGPSAADMQSCTFSGVTAANVTDFITESGNYDYLAYGACVPETSQSEMFIWTAETLADCQNMNGSYFPNTALTSNPGYNEDAGPYDGMFRCLNFFVKDVGGLNYTETGSYSVSRYGCQEAYYSAPNCQEADLVDITAENYASFNHSDNGFQSHMRGFGQTLGNFTHPRIPNVKSFDPSGACQGPYPSVSGHSFGGVDGGAFLSTSCDCLEGYCAYYDDCPQGSYPPQGQLSCGACGANCAQCASATLCDVCDTVTNGNAVAIGGDNSCTVSCDTGFYTVDGTVDGATCVDCAAIDNCSSVSCSTGSDQICLQCADGYSGEGSNSCTEIPSGQTAVYVVSTAYTFNDAFTSADIPNAKQDVATAAEVETSQVEMEIRAEARKKREGEVVVDVAIQYDDFSTAQAKAVALEATPVAFTTLKEGNSEIQDPVVAPYTASTQVVQDSSAPVFVGSLVMAILALF